MASWGQQVWRWQNPPPGKSCISVRIIIWKMMWFWRSNLFVFSFEKWTFLVVKIEVIFESKFVHIFIRKMDDFSGENRGVFWGKNFHQNFTIFKVEKRVNFEVNIWLKMYHFYDKKRVNFEVEFWSKFYHF